MFYYKDYFNNQWRKIDLKRLDFSQPYSEPVADQSLNIKDVTEKFNNGTTTTDPPITTFSPTTFPTKKKSTKSSKSKSMKSEDDEKREEK